MKLAKSVKWTLDKTTTLSCVLCCGFKHSQTNRHDDNILISEKVHSIVPQLLLFAFISFNRTHVFELHRQNASLWSSTFFLFTLHISPTIPILEQFTESVRTPHIAILTFDCSYPSTSPLHYPSGSTLQQFIFFN